MASPSSSLPSSPAARAFFSALDQSNNGGAKKQANSFVQKRIQTLGWRNRYSQDEFYPITVGGREFSVRQVQRGELENTYGTGATVWPASLVMIKYLERHAETLVAGKRIVDLGAGTAVTSLAAALLGASTVVCTDGEAKVVQLARDNIVHAAQHLSGTTSSDDAETVVIHGCPVMTQEYWWGSGQVEGGDDCDLVLVSDCVLPKLYPIAPLVEALDQLLVKPNAMAILSYEHRYYPEYDPRDHFRQLAHAKNLKVETVPESEQDPVYSVEDIEIWRVSRSV